MHNSDEQLESERESYLRQRYPGDLADILDKTSGVTSPPDISLVSHAPASRNFGKLFSSTLAASLFIGLTIFALYAPDQVNDDRRAAQTRLSDTPSGKTKRHARASLFHLTAPVTFAISPPTSARSAKLSTAKPKLASKLPTLMSLKTSAARKLASKSPKRRRPMWRMSFKQLAQNRTNTTNPSATSQEKPKRIRRSNRFRFRPIQPSLYRSG